ncbi:MAG TPA: hypothetical protein VLA77_04250 [Candidatus Saccharimonadales bacterium]|nr:hypothetical protein [Candidatus Saccharimonadales bacterium]
MKIVNWLLDRFATAKTWEGLGRFCVEISLELNLWSNEVAEWQADQVRLGQAKISTTTTPGLRREIKGAGLRATLYLSNEIRPANIRGFMLLRSLRFADNEQPRGLKRAYENWRLDKVIAMITNDTFVGVVRDEHRAMRPIELEYRSEGFSSAMRAFSLGAQRMPRS